MIWPSLSINSEIITSTTIIFPTNITMTHNTSVNSTIITRTTMINTTSTTTTTSSSTPR